MIGVAGTLSNLAGAYVGTLWQGTHHLFASADPRPVRIIAEDLLLLRRTSSPWNGQVGHRSDCPGQVSGPSLGAEGDSRTGWLQERFPLGGHRAQYLYVLRVGHANIQPERPRGRELRWDSHFFATAEQLTKGIANVLTPDGQQSPNTRWNHCAGL
jgi:hypothetical protein